MIKYSRPISNTFWSEYKELIQCVLEAKLRNKCQAENCFFVQPSLKKLKLNSLTHDVVLRDRAMNISGEESR